MGVDDSVGALAAGGHDGSRGTPPVAAAAGRACACSSPRRRIGRTFALPLLTEAAGVSTDEVLDAVDAGLADVGARAGARAGRRHLSVRARAARGRGAQLGEPGAPAAQARAHRGHARRAHAAMRSTRSRRTTRRARIGEGVLWCRRAAARAMSLYALDEAARVPAARADARDDGRGARRGARRAGARRRAVRALGRRGALVRRDARACRARGDPADARAAGAVAAPAGARATGTGRAGHGSGVPRAARRGGAGRAAPRDIVQTRSLLVQTLARAGRDGRGDRGSPRDRSRSPRRAATKRWSARRCIASRSRCSRRVRPTRSSCCSGSSRARASVAIRVMEARAFFSLGVARMRTRDDSRRREAFRSALAIARDAQALDVAANASMNLGVIGLRGGEFDVGARRAARRAASLHDAAQQQQPAGGAVQHREPGERARRLRRGASRLYRETAALADRLGRGRHRDRRARGHGLAALRLNDDRRRAHRARRRRRRSSAARHDWWFQGRELLESLVIRLQRTRPVPRRRSTRFRDGGGAARGDGRLRRGVAGGRLRRDAGGARSERLGRRWSGWQITARCSSSFRSRRGSRRCATWPSVCLRAAPLANCQIRPVRACRHGPIADTRPSGYRAHEAASAQRFPVDARRVEDRRLHGVGDVAPQLHMARRSPRELTRFISSTTNRPRSGSIQMDVPVKPVCPKLRGEKKRPALDCGAGVSQPSARLDAGSLSRRPARDRLRREDAHVAVAAAVEQQLREDGEIARGGEQARVAGRRRRAPTRCRRARCPAAARGSCRTRWARCARRSAASVVSGLNRVSRMPSGRNRCPATNWSSVRARDALDHGLQHAPCPSRCRPLRCPARTSSGRALMARGYSARPRNVW